MKSRRNGRKKGKLAGEKRKGKASIMILQHAVLRKKDIGMTKCIIEALQRLLGRMKRATDGFRDSPRAFPSP
jgi:hypothetical protein